MNIIPSHKCKNCGPVPINKKEFKKITEYVLKNKPKYNKDAAIMDCKFRVDGSCSIYSARPVLCKLMGVTQGMDCAYGNTKNIDGRKFIDTKQKIVGLMNLVIKTDY